MPGDDRRRSQFGLWSSGINPRHLAQTTEAQGSVRLIVRRAMAYRDCQGNKVNWHIFAASVVGALLGSVADWIFAGVLFHDRYQRHPEIWRTGASESLRIGAAQILCLLTSVAFVALASTLNLVDLPGTLKLAAMIWLIAPLPLLVTNSLFIKVDPLVTAGHAVGWLAKLLLIALATALLV